MREETLQKLERNLQERIEDFKERKDVLETNKEAILKFLRHLGSFLTRSR